LLSDRRRIAGSFAGVLLALRPWRVRLYTELLDHCLDFPCGHAFHDRFRRSGRPRTSGCRICLSSSRDRLRSVCHASGISVLIITANAVEVTCFAAAQRCVSLQCHIRRRVFGPSGRGPYRASSRDDTATRCPCGRSAPMWALCSRRKHRSFARLSGWAVPEARNNTGRAPLGCVEFPAGVVRVHGGPHRSIRNGK